MAWLTPEFLGAALVTLAGGMVRGFSGFGLGLVLVPLHSLIYGPAQAVGLLLLFQLASSVLLIPGSWPHIDKGVIGGMSLAAAAMVPLGAWVLVTQDPHLMRTVINGAVAGFALLLLAGWRYSGRPHPWLAIVVGAVSGLFGGMVGISGPPVVVFLFAGPDSASNNRHNLIGYFGVLNVVSLLVFLYGGVIQWETLLRAVALSPALYLGLKLGGRLFLVASDVMLRRVALVLI
ncbi:MAG: sulfite exporter TauE/SafE family protein, partial [Deltaproteobacteria bacterium]|nr:sulfite exporter TauE/SafE family protein [Deltaproteobacteria bacterium]